MKPIARFYYFLPYVFFLCFINCKSSSFSLTQMTEKEHLVHGEDLCTTKDGRDCNYFSLSSNLKDWQFEKLKPGRIVEHFIISKQKGVEFLFVVDNSSSMDKNLKKIGQNLSALLSYIKDLNWSIAFINADHEDHTPGKNQKWEDCMGDTPKCGMLMPLEYNGKILNSYILTNNNPHARTIFEHTISREYNGQCNLPPFCGGRNEQPLRSTLSAIQRSLDPNGINSSFFKFNLDTIVVIISDEDERKGESSKATTAEDVIAEYYSSFEANQKRLFGFSISVQDEDCYNRERNSHQYLNDPVSYGDAIGMLAALTGGENKSLCSYDYSSLLASISRKTMNLVNSITLMKQDLHPESLKVKIHSNDNDIMWKLEGRRVIFNKPLKPETKISVTYDYDTNTSY